MKGRSAFIIIGFFLAAWLAGGSSALADSTTAITSLSATIKLQSDGRAFVEQVIEFAEPTELSWPVFSNLHGISVTADSQILSKKDFSERGIGGQSRLSSKVSASQWVIDYTTTTTLIRHDDRDQIYFKLFQEPRRQVYNVAVLLELPASSSGSDLSGDLYAINGVLGPNFYKQGENQIVYSAVAAGASSIFTVNASWSKDVLPLGRYQQLRLQLLDLELTPWLVIGFLLPLISLLVLGEIYWRLRRDEKPVTAVINQPPNLLPPVLVGVLVNKKIYPDEIVSLIIDLATRGYIVIVKKNKQYSLSLRKSPDGGLQVWERDILSQIFPGGGKQSDTESSRALYSPEVRDAFSRIYQVITELQIFAENPHVTRVRYKLIALSFYYLSAVGLILTAVFGLSPLVLIPFTGTMLISFLIIRLSPRLIRYTAAGLKARRAWLSFGNCLKLAQPLPIEAAQNHIFESYLAYSIALRSTTQWADRFEQSSLTIVKPDWLVSYEDASTAELVEEITAFTGSLSADLTNLRGPIVN